MRKEGKMGEKQKRNPKEDLWGIRVVGVELEEKGGENPPQVAEGDIPVDDLVDLPLQGRGHLVNRYSVLERKVR
jgi:hypothetical protein